MGRDASVDRDNTEGFVTGGAYISESWERAVGDVSGEKRLRMLSHCICVVVSVELSVTRSETCASAAVGEEAMLRSSLSRTVKPAWTTESQ